MKVTIAEMRTIINQLPNLRRQHYNFRRNRHEEKMLKYLDTHIKLGGGELWHLHRIVVTAISGRAYAYYVFSLESDPAVAARNMKYAPMLLGHFPSPRKDKLQEPAWLKNFACGNRQEFEMLVEQNEN